MTIIRELVLEWKLFLARFLDPAAPDSEGLRRHAMLLADRGIK